jgi:hypothetical protein
LFDCEFDCELLSFFGSSECLSGDYSALVAIEQCQSYILLTKIKNSHRPQTAVRQRLILERRERSMLDNPEAPYECSSGHRISDEQKAENAGRKTAVDAKTG